MCEGVDILEGERKCSVMKVSSLCYESGCIRTGERKIRVSLRARVDGERFVPAVQGLDLIVIRSMS